MQAKNVVVFRYRNFVLTPKKSFNSSFTFKLNVLEDLLNSSDRSQINFQLEIGLRNEIIPSQVKISLTFTSSVDISEVRFHKNT